MSILEDMKKKGYDVRSSGYYGETLTKCGISKECRIGGVGGGSCWDTGEVDRHYNIDGDEEPEFDNLDSIIEEFCPNISFLHYKRIFSKLINKTEYCQNEYYGNHTDYMIHWVDIEELYNYLVSNELICDS